MPRKKKLINNSDLPDHEIEAIARCIYPDILELFERTKSICRMEGAKRKGGEIQ